MTQAEPAPSVVIEPTEVSRPRRSKAWIFDVLLILVLVIGVYFRFTGVNWDDNHHLHPDERFLTMVESALQPVKNLAQFFNTNISTLNPNNVGYTFFVYGTLPIFIVRYVAEWVKQTGYDQVFLVGRQASAIVDLLTVVLVYWIASRLYHKRVGLLAAAFAAFSVLPIQLSHYFTVDTFTNFFGYIAIFMAVIILTRKKTRVQVKFVEKNDSDLNSKPALALDWAAIIWNVAPYILFGLALGMATASKINAVVLALLMPLAVLIIYLRLPMEERRQQLWQMIFNMVVAGLVSMVIFRICQPYAFSGPGFFGLKLNPKWLANMQELANQSSGDVDVPFALQWARRPVWFAWGNMVQWGLGLPLGLLAWAAFLWMGWRSLRGEWQQHLLLWAWTAGYFTWQSLSWTSSMRYQMLVYPSLAIIAAWGVFQLWDAKKTFHWRRLHLSAKSWRIIAGVIGVGVVLATAAWAFAFTRIYTRPLTRVEASQWIFQNVPAPINLKIGTTTGPYNQPLPYHFGVTVTPDQPYTFAFKPQTNGVLTSVQFYSILDQANPNLNETLLVNLATSANPSQTLANGLLVSSFPAGSDSPGKSYQVPLDLQTPLDSNQTYLLKVSLAQSNSSLSLYGPTVLTLFTAARQVLQSLPPPVQTIEPGKPFSEMFTATVSGEITSVYIPHVVDQSANQNSKTLSVTVSSPGGNGPISQVATVDGNFDWVGDGRGVESTFTFAQPLKVEKGIQYALNLEMTQGAGVIALYGSAPAIESTWDDPLPLSVDGYWPYDFTSGLYEGDQNFEMYWPDDADKLARFETILDQSDYILISSNRQWGSTVRVPERYPLTTEYYRNLIGCPPGKDILWCYSVATPGMFSGKLGYDLVKISQSEPTLGPITFNTQFAEEAFTVYDHPKVLIFKKNADYTPTQVNDILGAVDLSHVVNVTPRKVSANPPPTMMLPADRLAQQEAGGTWADLFSRLDLQNRYPIVGVVLWYLAISLLGLFAYPIVRLALPGLPDRGYPLARLTGMLVLAYIVWIAGSYGIPYTQLTINLVIGGIALCGIVLAYLQRDGLRQEWKEKKRYFLTVEAIALAFFVFFLLIRLGNSDLWHPYHGGEKPMDFSYLNAVIKSTTFPPYDPWFAGGSLNYYYYGYVIVGTLIKWLGIVPSFAYNLVLPLLYSLVAIGAFSIGWNISQRRKKVIDPEAGAGDGDAPPEQISPKRGYLIGLAASFGMVVLGNLGTVRMIWQGFQRIAAAPGVDVTKVSALTRWVLSAEGVMKFITGTRLPFAPGDWYWIPSRTIPGEPITEFPMFTFLYADLHAHMIALPLTVMVLAWALAIVMGRAHWGEPDGRLKWLSVTISFLLAGITIGALWPTNSWDYPTYLALAALALIYTLWCYFTPPRSEKWSFAPTWLLRAAVAVGAALILVALSRIMYQPYYQWYGQGYNSFDIWNGARTPFWSYITHWGLFLFVIVCWMGWETYHWLATTPLSSVKKLLPYRNLIAAFIFGFLVVVIYLTAVEKIEVAWLVLLLAVWALVLLVRPDTPDVKRLVLFLIGTGLVLTMACEMIALHGDLGRMNTVFKLYYQCWTLFAISSAAGVAWLLEAIPGWSYNWRTGWKVAFSLLVFGAALFPVFASVDKITNRMSPIAPRTLDGMTYMAYSSYNDQGNVYNLDEDYRAIIWMQENVKGSPVIVEGNTPEYRWGSRFTVYTGLPGVVGWNWHQRQQRALTPPELVTDRIAQINDFYLNEDVQSAVNFLKRYNVSYIIVGRLEEANYPGKGLDKFPQNNGKYWQTVYHDGDTTIYQVIK